LIGQVAYGHGIERYINDTSGLGIDAAVSTVPEPHLQALPVFATYGAYQHWWTPKLRSSAIYGFLQVDNTGYEPGTDFRKSTYLAGNLIWKPFPRVNLGTEVLYGSKENKAGAKANDTRFMLSAKYDFDFVNTPGK
jgi:hypothetical protein